MKQKTKLWEYLIETDSNVGKINELGSNGWELVSVICFPSSLSLNSLITNYYFKRQIR